MYYHILKWEKEREYVRMYVNVIFYDFNSCVKLVADVFKREFNIRLENIIDLDGGQTFCFSFFKNCSRCSIKDLHDVESVL